MESVIEDTGDVQINATRSYKDAIIELNSMQTAEEVFESLNIERKIFSINKMATTRKYFECTGMTFENLDELSVIHITGTKGKGSTCSYVENILRHNGYTTGFFSSPHLKEYRERIRINGTPISREKFAKYFWYCFDRIQANCGDTLPQVFQLLTVLSFYVFWREKVHACIVEVGIGGRYDNTNIVRNPIVCGITHLGIDHATVLGDTIQSIAEHKAGIFKANTSAVTSCQVEEALEVLKHNAKDIKCGLFIAPNLSSYKDLLEDPEIQEYEDFQKENLSLALQLCRIWLHNFDKDLNKRKWVESFSGPTIPILNPFIPDVDIIVPALKSTFWPGRAQILKRENATYYLDGAHTNISMKCCSAWFKKKSAAEIKDLCPNKNIVKILLFNVSGDRDPHNMMLHLKDCGFDFVIFAPNICYPDVIPEDQKRISNKENVTLDSQQKWLELQNGIPDQQEGGRDVSNENPLSVDVQVSKEPTTKIFNTIYEALHWCCQGNDHILCSRNHLMTPKDIPSRLKDADHIQVLVTGSVYLVGGVLTVFDYAI